MRIVIGFVLFVSVFLGGVAIRDYSYERFLQANKGRIQKGMSEAEVISILSQPTSKSMTDGPGLYWCYGSSTWDQFNYGDVYCGSVEFLVSPNGYVEDPPR